MGPVTIHQLVVHMKTVLVEGSHTVCISLPFPAIRGPSGMLHTYQNPVQIDR